MFLLKKTMKRAHDRATGRTRLMPDLPLSSPNSPPAALMIDDRQAASACHHGSGSNILRDTPDHGCSPKLHSTDELRMKGLSREE